jgi:small nuclear ribonucleoprotein G
MAPAQPELKKVRNNPSVTTISYGGKFDYVSGGSPLLMQYLDKKLFVQLNGSRKVIGVLRGYDVC